MNRKFNLTFSILVFVIVCSASQIFAQGEIDDQERVYYRNERTWGLLVNANGYGLDFRYAKYKNQFNSKLFSLELVEIKHPKEFKQATYSTTSRFVYGKMNKFYALRAGIGLQRERFEKIDKGGISIRSFYMAGLSLGVMKPIYYEVYLRAKDTIVDARFDPNTHQWDVIYGKSGFFKGMSEITATPGTFIKFGFSFEYSKNDKKVRAFEAAAQLDAYLLKPEIMALTANPHLILTLQVCYRWGKVIDSL